MSLNEMEKIKVSMEYNSQRVNEEVPPYKPLKYLKEIASKKFHPIKLKINLTYNGRNISKYENVIIGEFFKNQKNVLIKIEDINNLENNNSMIEEKKVNKKNKYSCDECGNYTISDYCREDSLFLCNHCRVNANHRNHKVAQVDINNLDESCKLYTMILQNEICENKKIKKKDNKNKSNKNNNILIDNNYLNEDLLNEKHQNVLDNFNDIKNKHNNIMSNLKTNNENLDEIITKFNENSKENSKELDSILNDINKNYTKKKKKMNLDEFKEYIDKIHNKDIDIQNISMDLNKMKLKNTYNNNLNNMYDDIEKILNIYNNDKNLFNTSDEINQIYENILRSQQSNEVNESNNNTNNNNEGEENENNNNEGEENENNNNEGEENENNNEVNESNNNTNNNNEGEENESNNKEGEENENNNNEGEEVFYMENADKEIKMDPKNSDA